MKRLFNFVLVLFLTVSAIACGDGDGTEPDASAQDEAFERLSGQWTLGTAGEGSIVVDGIDATLNYSNFSLSFNDGTYQTQNAGDLLNASGNWVWADEEARQIQIDSDEVITINELTETRFRFSFTSDGSVAAGIAGNYTITVVK